MTAGATGPGARAADTVAVGARAAGAVVAGGRARGAAAVAAAPAGTGAAALDSRRARAPSPEIGPVPSASFAELAVAPRRA